MSAYLEDVFAAFRTRINVAWPDVTADGIFEAEHADMIPWDFLEPPYAVILIEGMSAGEWGMDNLSFEANVQLFYVGIIAGPSEPIRAKLEALRDDLRVNELSTGQVIDLIDLDWSMQLEPNQVFLSKNYSHRAGRLTAYTIWGQTIGPGNA